MGSKLSRASSVMGISPQLAQCMHLLKRKEAQHLRFGAAMSKSESRDSLKLTRICKYWPRRCYNGYRCTFAHSSAELRDAPNLVRTELCYQFLSRGQCSKGAACTFAHGQEELRPGVEVQRSGDPMMDSQWQEAESTQTELLMKMCELQMQILALQSLQVSVPPSFNKVSEMARSVGSFRPSAGPVLGGNYVGSPSLRSESFWL